MESPPPTYEMTFHTQSDTSHDLKLKKKRIRECIILCIFVIIFFLEGSIAVLTIEECSIANGLSARVIKNSALGACIIFFVAIERYIYNETGHHSGIIFLLVLTIFLFYLNIVDGSYEIISAAKDNQKFLQTEMFFCSKTFYINTILC